MQALVELNDREVAALDELARKIEQPREKLIHDAIADLLARQLAPPTVPGFGLWGDQLVDGLDYQNRLRGE